MLVKQSPRRLGALLCVSALALASVPAAAKVQKAKVGSQSLASSGEINLTKLASGTGGGIVPFAATANSASPSASERVLVGNGMSARAIPLRLPAITVRRPALASLPNDAARVRAVKVALGLHAATSTSPAALAGFNGLRHYDQRYADNGNQFSLEPPDQAMASDGRYVLEAVNNALTVFDASGKQLINPVSINRFFNLQSEYNRSNGQYGPSLSDPRAYYDADSKRWFVFEWGVGKYANGQDLGNSQQFVAISATSNPLGNYYVFNYDTTNANLPNCPCIPDFQQIGIDKNGVYVTNNLFGLGGTQPFAGSTVYAFPKTAASNGAGVPIVQFVLPNDFTVHPAVVPPKGTFATAENGTQYFMEALADISQTGTASAVRVFAVSNTNSLANTDPTTISLTLNSVDVPTQTYSEPYPVQQPDGPRPYAATLVKSGQKLPPVPQLDGGSARFSSNPTYVSGNLWGVVNDGLANASGSGGRNGLAYFVITPSGGATMLSATVTTQGVITAPGAASVFYGAIAMPVTGRGGIGFTLSGPGNYPSTGVAALSIAGWGPLQLTGIGALPDDGFTGYTGKPFKQGVGRWGDYAAAAVDPSGALVFANEYIPDTAMYPRSLFANWGTFITTIRP